MFFFAESNHSSVNTNLALCTLKNQKQLFWKGLNSVLLALYTAVYIVFDLSRKVCVHFQCSDEKIKWLAFMRTD